jgi:N-acetylglucosamine kinase-like BadF-type ATPase
MIILESGRSKTTLIYYNDNGLQIEVDKGISAIDGFEVLAKFLESKAEIFATQKEKIIHWYLSGYLATFNGVLQKELDQRFPDLSIKLYSDLEAVAHATLKNEDGYVGILGSGANFGVYKGQKILPKYQSLGYFLADQGSGFGIAQQLLEDYFRLKMANDFHTIFEQTVEPDRFEIVMKYKDGSISEYLKKLTPICSEHRAHPYIQALLADQFAEYFQYIKKFLAEKKPFFLVGSIAQHFKDELYTASKVEGITISGVIQSPAIELYKYHELYSQH